jgi:hypothetical protein
MMVMGFESADDYLTKPTQPMSSGISRQSYARQREKTVYHYSMYRTLVGVIGARGLYLHTVNLGVALRNKKDVIIADFRPGQGSS